MLLPAGAASSSRVLHHQPPRRSVSSLQLIRFVFWLWSYVHGTLLCLSISGIKLVKRWAVDINEHACKSLKLNHPETELRNEPAEDFLNLIKAWAKLCEDLKFLASNRIVSSLIMDEDDANDEVDDGNEASKKPSDLEEFEAERFLAICYGDPNNVKKPEYILRVMLILFVEDHHVNEQTVLTALEIIKLH
ncbi:Alpha-1,3-mannosyltransferase cmt1 [Stylosanthes scabra]|uniref:Alpha-1,3-mannosyltransferase cmt1 n=1 Tax=Stylosanthes scabra TaxID=79078 RepID=A0ABU6UBV7_9FABA|nr:Alpha-1,3-mannosyltransferase cmt1 [Stylosanthes scabra]